MIKNLVFDMGNVLIKWTPDYVMERNGITDSEDRELLKRHVFCSSDWPLLDWGILNEEQIIALSKERLPERLHAVAEEMVNDWDAAMNPVPGIADIIRKYKKHGLGIYLLSNASTRLRGFFGRIEGSECFDGIVVSAEEKLIKPIPEIYLRLLNRYSLKADECIFIDDLPVNVASARFVGMRGYVFNQDVKALADYLETEIGK